MSKTVKAIILLAKPLQTESGWATKLEQWVYAAGIQKNVPGSKIMKMGWAVLKFQYKSVSSSFIPA